MKNATVTSFQRNLILSLCLQNARVLAGLLAAAFLVSNAHAAAIVWSGASGTDTNWSNGNNWVGNAAPGGGDDVKFFDAGANGTAGTPNNLADGSFAGYVGSLQYGNTNGFHTTLIANGVTLNITNTGGQQPRRQCAGGSRPLRQRQRHATRHPGHVRSGHVRCERQPRLCWNR
jgi:hypothetical protein